MPEKEFVSPDELAAYLDVPVRSIYAWRHQGNGPRGHKIGRHVRYRRADVEAWLMARADPNSPAA